MSDTADMTGGKPIAVLLQSIFGVSAINTLVAFYDIHGGKREVLFFYFVPDTTRDIHRIFNWRQILPTRALATVIAKTRYWDISKCRKFGMRKNITKRDHVWVNVV
jgi:hypothetical protein